MNFLYVLDRMCTPPHILYFLAESKKGVRREHNLARLWSLPTPVYTSGQTISKGVGREHLLARLCATVMHFYTAGQNVYKLGEE